MKYSVLDGMIGFGELYSTKEGRKEGKTRRKMSVPNKD
jgi:hypothetical protein